MENQTNIKENICKNISRAISSGKIKVSELAKACNLSITSVARWRDGQCLPDVNLFPTICKLLDISLYEFLGLVPDNNLSNNQQDILHIYSSDDNFRNLIDKYRQNPEFRETISQILKLSK